jgi:hypothetical protein
MLRNYQYLVGTNVNREYEGTDLKSYIEGQVGAAVTGIVGMAPEDLNTLSELATAIGNDPDFLSSLSAKDADLLAAVGISAGDQSIGDMSSTELPDNETVKQLFEMLGEATRRVREGLGVAQGDSDLGTFTGSILSDNTSVKNALQELETYSETNSAAAVQTYVDQQIATDMWMFADQAAFPAAASNHGRVVHSHADGAMFYAHAGAWHKLQTDSAVDGDESSLQAAIDAAVARIDALELDPATATSVAAVQADVDQNEVDSDAAEAALSGRLDVLEVDPTTQGAVDAVNQSLTTSLGSLNGDVVANKTASDAAEAALSGRVDTLEVDPTTAAAVTSGDAATLTAANSYTDTEIANLVDSAPGALNTLNELSASLGDDADFAGTVTATVAAETTARIAGDSALDVRLLTLEADPATSAGVAAVQADVDQNEADADAAIAAVQADVDQNEADADAAIAANEVHIDNLVSLSGVAKDAANLGAFTGTLIGANQNVKQALQDLSDEIETFDVASGIADILDGTSNFTNLKLRNTTILADGDEINLLNGVTATTAEINFIDGVTSNIQTQLNAIQADVDTNESDADTAIAAVQADVDQNEADADAAIAAEETRALAAEALLAPLNSAALTGTPTAPTAGAGTNTTQLATTAFVSAAVANVIDSAPGALDTLNELAAAIADDANFSTTITNSIAAVQSDVDQNELDADNAIAAVQADVDQNESDADAAIALKLDASAVSTFGGTLVDDADAAAARTTLGLGDVATTAAADYATAAQGATADAALAASAVSTFGGTLIDDADAAAARTTLGLGTVATTAATAYATAAQGTLADSAVQPADISNVDNTSDANKPVSTATQAALDALVGAAPAGLNTLEELADAIENDVAAIENVTTLINTESGHVDNLATLSGVAKDSVNLGAFSGATISDNGTVKAGMQELETAIEAGITLASFKAVVAASSDFADFKSRVAAL